MKNEIGLVEFMEKYMTIKNVDGSFSKPTEQMLEMAKVIETAQNEGYDLKLVRGRGSDKIAFVKKVYSPPAPTPIEIRTDMKWTDYNMWIDPEMRQKALDCQKDKKPMKKTHKVVMLATEKASNIGLVKDTNHLYFTGTLNAVQHEMQHLYFVSDDEIKEGDYIYNGVNGTIINTSLTTRDPFNMQRLKLMKNVYKDPIYKIVATTDKSLKEIEGMPFDYFLPQIPESFIQDYIKDYNDGNPITEIDLEVEEVFLNNSSSMELSRDEFVLKVKTNPDNTIII